jgi:hypothetical protein
MSQTKKILEDMNPGLFIPGSQVAVPHSVIVSEDKARAVKNDKGEVIEHRFVKTSDRDIPGMPKSKYLRASFKKAGEQVQVALDNGETRRAFRGSKRAQAGNIFKNQQPNLFNLLADELREKKYTKAGTDNDGNAMVEADLLVYGKKISVNVPTYIPQETDENGKRKGLTATKFDPKTGQYVENATVHMGVYEFFADEDDLDKLLEVAARLVDRHVIPYVTEKITTTVEKPGEVSVKTEEAALSTNEEIASTEAPAVETAEDDV